MSQKYVEKQFIVESDAVLRELETTALLGQKRTSLHKALVFLLPQRPEIVYKGPFMWPQKAQMMALALFRANLFANVWKGGCAISGPIEIVRFSGGKTYFRMPHVAARKQTGAAVVNALDGEKRDKGEEKARWVGKQEQILGEEQLRTVASKDSQGILELSAYLERPVSFQQDSVLVDSLLHFIQRYIADPIVGDAALRNVLVCVANLVAHVAVGIDFEENRTGDDEKRKSEESGGFFAMICGGKLWNRNALRLLDAALRRGRQRILDHLRNDIDASWAAVENLIAQHCLSTTLVSVERMRRRCAAIVASVLSLSEISSSTPASALLSAPLPLSAKRKEMEETDQGAASKKKKHKTTL